ncbi:MAG: Uma2 family endonuclease [Chloroflexi bacterium]|nr:Uma2 family endonuclease [Chloroflexota bacterium]
MMHARLVTAEELARMPEEDAHVELVKGVVVRMTPAGHAHGRFAARFASLLDSFVRERRLGYVYAAETGFMLSRNPDTVRAPDAAFVTGERAAAQPREEGFFEGAPDLAVEVVSPSDSYLDVEAKVQEYLDAGARLVWVLNPRTKTLMAYRPDGSVRRYTIDDTLDGENVLPGFAVPLKDIFE